jgi:hypothetical protein
MHEYISRTLGYLAAGRLTSPKDKIGESFVNADGSEYVVFKQTVLKPLDSLKTPPEAMFRVQFRVAKIRRWRDRFVIALKAPIFVGAPGFRSKLWMVDAKNDTYQGVYEWDTLADAEDYAHSASMDFMTEVAVAGGISYEVLPGARVAERGTALAIEAS